MTESTRKEAFVHLHCHTEYSLLDGHGRIKQLVQKAKDLGQPALAITDHGYMYGVVQFYDACKAAGIKPILGVELYMAADIHEKKDRKAGHIILLAKNNQGYQNLVKIESIAAIEGFYYKPRTDLNILRKYHEGIICLSACIQGDVPQLLLAGKKEEAYALAAQYKDIFGEDYYIELQYHGLEDQKKLLYPLLDMANALDIQVVATNDVHYVEKQDAFAQRTLMCMGMKKTVDDKDALGHGNPPQWYFKSEAEMREIFDRFAPKAVSNTMVIADKCNVELKHGEYHLPKFPLPASIKDNATYLRLLCENGLYTRYRKDAEAHRERLEYELQTIEKMGFADYFLIVADIISYAKNNHIPVGPGRGSSAGSMVAYCLEITDIEPTKFGLLFERFLNPERVTMPDVDIDISPEGRELVIQHIIEKYGEDHIARIITYSSLAAKGAIRDVGKALGMDDSIILRIGKYIPSGPDVTIASILDSNREMKKEYDENADIRKLLDISMSVEGLIRHTSTHAAGVIIAPEAMTNFVPIQKDKNGAIISQFEMGSVEAVGMLKVDLLGLKTLDVLNAAEKAVNEAKQMGERKLNLARLKMADKSVYEMLSKGQTTGVFQLESSGMRDVLRKLKPTCIEDLIAAISLYRPGPMDSIPKFIQNKHKPESITYAVPELEPILKDTYGCIVYQEQVMQIVRTLAGYSFGRADLVRRAMSKKKHDVMEREHEVFLNGSVREDGTVEVEGCIHRGIPAAVAEKIWSEMASFASYAFNKSHAASYAVVAYRTAFMRCHYPKEFLAALMTNEIDGTKEKMVTLFADCDVQGIKLLPPDINRSQTGFSVEGDNIRFGLLAIKDTGRVVLSELIMERNTNGPFKDLQDLVERTVMSANKSTLEALIKSGALDCFPHSREAMLAVLPTMLKAASKARKAYSENQMTLDESFFSGEKADQEKFHFEAVEYPTDVPQLSTLERLKMEQEATGMFISGHPMDSYKDEVSRKTTHTLCQVAIHDEDLLIQTLDIKDDTSVRVAGVITRVKKLTTKKKQQMAFITIEDQTDKLDVTIFPKAYDSYGSKLAEGLAILVYGRIQNAENERKVVADSISFLDKTVLESKADEEQK